MKGDLTRAALRKMLRESRKRLHECRALDFERGRVNSSAATEDALSRFLLLDELVNSPAELELTGGDQ